MRAQAEAKHQNELSGSAFKVRVEGGKIIAYGQSAGELRAVMAQYPDVTEDIIVRELRLVFQDELGVCMPALLDLYFHYSLGIPCSSNPRNPSVTSIARSCPVNQGRPYFSNVVCRGEQDDEHPEVDWYGRVVAFLSFTAAAQREGTTRRREYALIKYYEQVRVDRDIGMPVLKWEGYSMTDVRSILRLAHVVERWGDDEKFHLNTDKLC